MAQVQLPCSNAPQLRGPGKQLSSPGLSLLICEVGTTTTSGCRRLQEAAEGSRSTLGSAGLPRSVTDLQWLPVGRGSLQKPGPVPPPSLSSRPCSGSTKLRGVPSHPLPLVMPPLGQE